MEIPHWIDAKHLSHTTKTVSAHVPDSIAILLIVMYNVMCQRGRSSLLCAPMQKMLHALLHALSSNGNYAESDDDDVTSGDVTSSDLTSIAQQSLQHFSA